MIDPGTATIGASLISAIGGYSAQSMRSADVGRQQEWQSLENTAQRDFLEYMSSTAYRHAVEDMKQAGLNPMLAYSQGGAQAGTAGGGGVGLPQRENVLGAAAEKGIQALSASSAAEVNAAAVRKADAETALLGAQKNEVEARTPTYAVSMDKMRQDIQQSIATVENLQQQARTGAASAAHLNMQTRSLEAALPQIEATTKHLNALVSLVKAQTATEGERPRLTRAQTDEAISRLGLNDQETQKLKQYISANLPQIEADVKKLVRAKMEFEQPGQKNEAVAQGSLLGAWSTALRHILPIGQILGIGK